MQLRQFTSSFECLSHAHCTTCRDPEERAFRESLKIAFTLPRNRTDFACPHGRRWGGQYPVGAIEEDRTPRPGTALATMLGWFDILPLAGCNCKSYAAQMNRAGLAWCEDNVDTIVGLLREEAGKRGMRFNGFGAWCLVRFALSWARTIA